MNETFPLRLSESVAGVGTANAMKNASDRKQQLIGRSALYHKAYLFVPGKEAYVSGFRAKPEQFASYSGGDEPVVSADSLYDLPDEAWLTVNHYNALVLNTSNLLIADVDFGDERLSGYAGVEDYSQVIENLEQLELLDEEIMTFEKWKVAEQSYRVYRTHSGCRVVCTSKTFPWSESAWHARRLMQFLRADPHYVLLCDTQKCYRARLTPKPWRGDVGDSHVCDFVTTVGNGHVAHELKEQLRLHDELTLAGKNREWSVLA
jgi:hypothetical protein